MSKFKTLLTAMYKNSIRKKSANKNNSKGKTIAMYVTIGLGFLPLSVMLLSMVYAITPQFMAMDYLSEFIVMIFAILQGMVFIFGIIGVIANIFFSKDKEFLASLPVKNSTIVTVKLARLYISDLIISSLILIPSLIVIAVSASLHQMSLPIIYYFGIPLAILFIPFIPILLISLVSFPLMYVVSFFKKKGAASSIAIILIYTILMSLYFIVFSNMKGKPTVTSGFGAGLAKFSKILFFNKALADIMLAKNILINLAIFVGTLIPFAVISIFLMSLLYKKSVMNLNETSTENVKEGKIENKASISKALMLKEIRTLVRFPSLAFQSLIGLVITPIIIIFGSKQISEHSGNNLAMMTGFIMQLSVMMMSGMNYIANVAITRDGKYFYMNKLLPITPKMYIKSKVNISLLYAIVGSIEVGIITLIKTKSIFLCCVIIVSSFVINTGFVYLAIYNDLKKPKLDWDDMREAVKKNMNASIPMFIAMGISVIFIALGIILNKFITSAFYTGLVFGSTQILIGLIIYAICKTLLYKNLQKLIDNIDC